jgi:hypothetical protein
MANDLRRVDNFDADTVESRGQGVSGSAPAGQTTNIDLTLADFRLFTGLAFQAHNAQIGDVAHLEVVHPTAGTLLRFYDSWQVNPEQACQGIFQYPYTARLVAGLILRVVYVATNEGVARHVAANYFLHRDKGQ